METLSRDSFLDLTKQLGLPTSSVAAPIQMGSAVAGGVLQDVQTALQPKDNTVAYLAGGLLLAKL